MSEILLSQLKKSYGTNQVVHGVDLKVQDQEFVVLVGPSGCGKSTILRMVAGLETITSGEVKIGERVVNQVPPKDRNIAMVFQNYALYPHMSVFENMSFALKIQKKSKPEIQKSVEEAAKILGIQEYLSRKPSELSGGQRQRVAMGRALVRNPKVFLFDEPLSNLDAKLRNQMRAEIRKLHKKMKTTTLYVTHDQVEAMTLADRIVILKDGYIQQVGSPLEVYEKPANTFVAGFIGSPPMNIINSSSVPELNLPQSYIGIRPEHLHLSPEGISSAKSLKLKVQLVEPLGADTLVHLRVKEEELIAKFLGHHDFKTENEIEVFFNEKDLHKFSLETQGRL